LVWFDRRAFAAQSGCRGSRLAKATYSFYRLAVDFWPDNQAVSPSLNARRTLRPSKHRKAEPMMRNRAASAQVNLGQRKDISMNSGTMHKGTVKFYNDQKGFGFIQPEDGSKDVFVHATALERAGMRGLVEGQKVAFDTQEDRRTGKIAVGNIQTV
jgi:CspA family cold shock protein